MLVKGHSFNCVVKIALFHAAIFFAVSSQAADGVRKKWGIAYQFGLGYGVETLENSALSKRNMQNYNFNGMLGLRFRKLAVGGFAEYRNHNQSTDPTTVGDTNASGTSLIYGPQAKFYLGSRIILSASYFLSGSYNVEATTAAGESVTYSSPSGYRGAISLKLKKMLYLDLSYSKIKYGTSDVGSVHYELASDPIQATTMDFGFSLAF